MNLYECTLLALDPSRILGSCGLTPDPWQRDFLFARDRQVLLNCSRQSGKSTVVSALALHAALFTPGGLVLLLSPSQRQSAEIFRKVHDAYVALEPADPGGLREPAAAGTGQRRPRPVPARPRGDDPLVRRRDAAGARRGGAHPGRLVSQRAAHAGRVARPAGGLSTPFGQRGWFYEEWNGDGPWKRVAVTWRDCPRITADFIAEETRSMGAAWVAQEYECLFTRAKAWFIPISTDAVIGEPVAGRRTGRRRGRHRLRLAQPVRGAVGRAGPRRRAVDRLGALSARDAAARTRGGAARTQGRHLVRRPGRRAPRSRSCGRPA